VSAYQRRKGARLELEARDLLRSVFPTCERRASGEESQQDQGRDLKCTPGWRFQVTGGARPNILKKFAEAATGLSAGECPAAITKLDRGEWLVTIRASDFVELIGTHPATYLLEGP